jgi:hypothetical protein
LFLSLPQLGSIRVLGVAAEMRQTLDQAKATLEQLRGFAVPMAKATLRSLSGMGSYGSAIPKEEQDHVRDQLRKSLREVGVSDSEIAEALPPSADPIPPDTPTPTTN